LGVVNEQELLHWKNALGSHPHSMFIEPYFGDQGTSVVFIGSPEGVELDKLRLL